MFLGVKSNLLHCLESDLLEDIVNNHAFIPDAKIFDGAVVVQIQTLNHQKDFKSMEKVC